jgi:hypothetical protein
MAALDTVAKVISEARVLLQDTVNSPYRYSDPELLSALNQAFPEAKRIRPDLFLSLTMPEYTVVDTTAISLNEMYRMALVYYIAGRAQLRDDEDVQDQRAAAFLQMFATKLAGGM